MELCPVSNSFTNLFDDVEVRLSSPDQAARRGVYPLRQFLHAGLDICLNTDNRSLHAPGQNTLTADYLRAAQMVGGLTRWEVLKVVKSGFKHAFLPKDEIAALLRHVEFEMYQLASDDASGQAFPSPGGGLPTHL
jgi:adenosine deaminase